MRFLALLALCLITSILPAHAAPPVCNAGAEGTIVYNKDSKLVQFCNGTDWIGMVAQIGGTGDTLGDLSCASGEVPEWDGSAWVCGAGGTGLWTDSGNGYLTYTGADTGILLNSVTGMAAPTSTLADLGCTTNEILKWDGTNWVCAADDAGALADDAVTNAKMADDAIGIAELSATGTASGTTFLRGDNTWATISTGLPTLASASIWVGNGSNAATAVAMSGDATLSNAGVLTIGSNAVGSAEITNSSVALADLSATGTASATTYLRGDNTWATPTISSLAWSALTGVPAGFADGTDDGIAAETDPQVGTTTASNFCKANVGGTAIDCATAAIVSADITDSTIVSADIAADTVAAVDIATGGVGTAEILDGTITLGDLSATGTASGTTFLRGDNTWAAPSVTETDPQVGTTTASNFCKANVGGTAIDCATAAITSADITDSTIVSADIAADTVAAVDIATGGVGTAEILDGTITLGDLSATGTASATTFLRGDNTWATPSGGGGAANYQSFTSSGTWTKPGTGTVAFVECWGGGGAGGRGNGSSVGGAGGGGGGYVSRLIPFTSLTATVAITIGAGGTATATNNTAGGNGGNTTFGSYLTAYGGAGGGPNNTSGLGNGGGGGTPWAAGARPSTDPNADGAGGVCNISGTTYPPKPGLYAGGGGGCVIDGGASSFYGGGGGGSWYTSAFAPGVSVHAGNGGAAASGSATAGSVPSGGGGGTVNGTSGAGGAGRCQVTAW